jgi:hypothetical protein
MSNIAALPRLRSEADSQTVTFKYIAVNELFVTTGVIIRCGL